jgi:hypothetical protein
MTVPTALRAELHTRGTAATSAVHKDGEERPAWVQLPASLHWTPTSAVTLLLPRPDPRPPSVCPGPPGGPPCTDLLAYLTRRSTICCRRWSCETTRTAPDSGGGHTFQGWATTACSLLRWSPEVNEDSSGSSSNRQGTGAAAVGRLLGTFGSVGQLQGEESAVRPSLLCTVMAAAGSRRQNRGIVRAHLQSQR